MTRGEKNCGISGGKNRVHTKTYGSLGREEHKDEILSCFSFQHLSLKYLIRVGHFLHIKIQLGSEDQRTHIKQTNKLMIIQFPMFVSFKPHCQAKFNISKVVYSNGQFVYFVIKRVDVTFLLGVCITENNSTFGPCEMQF